MCCSRRACRRCAAVMDVRGGMVSLREVEFASNLATWRYARDLLAAAMNAALAPYLPHWLGGFDDAEHAAAADHTSRSTPGASMPGTTVIPGVVRTAKTRRAWRKKPRIHFGRCVLAGRGRSHGERRCGMTPEANAYAVDVRAVLTPFALVFMLALPGNAVAHGVAGPHDRFIAASPKLIGMCVATAKAVGYPVPCPTRVPVALVASGGRPGCELQIIGPAKPCPNTAFVWKGWVVGSSTTEDEHLVLTASPRIVRSAAKVVNGPVLAIGPDHPRPRLSTSRTLAHACGVRPTEHQRRQCLRESRRPDLDGGAAHLRSRFPRRLHDQGTLALDLELAEGVRLVSA